MRANLYEKTSPQLVSAGICAEDPQRLPWARSSQDAQNFASELAPYTKSRPAHILIIDDSRADARLMEEALKETKATHRVTILGSGEEAIDFLQHPHTAKPDIILLDLHLPRMSGQRVLEWIKQDGNLRSIPVVVLSGSTKPEEIRDSYAAQANCFLQKPMDLNDLVKLLARITEFWLGFALPSAQL